MLDNTPLSNLVILITINGEYVLGFTASPKYSIFILQQGSAGAAYTFLKYRALLDWGFSCEFVPQKLSPVEKSWCVNAITIKSIANWNTKGLSNVRNNLKIS